ncbi:MAG TPA: GNAT family N-acetyltransferase [Candidatus Thermoplasmatota archaeon]|nr:GNAT family N-acetyltransferase [Candidatus Thermoplasmatota archaeon]
MKKNSFTIRPGTSDDLDAFFELYWISSLEHTHYSGQLDSLKPKERCREYIIDRQRGFLNDPNCFFLIAEQDGKILGMVTGHVGDRDEAAIYAIERMGFIDEVCVAPEHRQHGVGKHLIEELLGKLYSTGISYVGVGVAFKNPAFHFYKTQGFTPEGLWLIQEKRQAKKRKTKR